jgi:hypothetical protein
MTYYKVEFLTGSTTPRQPKRFRTEEKAKQHAKKVLGITDESGLASKATILPVSRKHLPVG